MFRLARVLRDRVARLRGHRVALIASLDDPAFDPDTIRGAVGAIAAAVDEIWAGARSDLVSARPDARLLEEWAAQIVQSTGPGVRIARPPTLRIIGLVNREGEQEDRIVARVRIALRRDTHSMTWPGDGTIMATRRARFTQRWTLMRVGGQWYLASAVPAGHDRVPFARARIASAVDDSARLREAALRELAGNDRTPHPAELIDHHSQPGTQLTELAMLDERFSPALIEATLRRVIECWEIAGVGSEAPLRAICTTPAITQLRHPAGAGMTRTIHDASLNTWTVTRLDAAAAHPTITTQVTINGTWRNQGARFSGAAGGPFRTLREVWTLALRDGPDGQPQWRLVHSGPPRGH
jgi:hypothetical protein